MTDEPAVPAEVLPTKAEAEAWDERLNAKIDAWELSTDDLADELIAARESGMWKSLDCKSWNAYLDTRTRIGQRRARQLIAHGLLRRELTTAAGGNTVPPLKEGQTRKLSPKARADLVEEVEADPEQAPSAIERALAEANLAQERNIVPPLPAEPEPEQKRTPTSERHPVTHDLTDSEWSALLALSIAASTPHEAEATKLLRAAIRLATLAAEAGVAEPVRFLERELAAFVETGEVVTRPPTNGRTRQRQPAEPAQSNGDCPKHVASKPGLSGLVVCTLCGLPRNKWPLATSTAGAGPKVERQRVEVESRLKK